MKPFFVNGILWNVIRVKCGDPRLVDRNGKCNIAATDPNSHIVYLCNELHGVMLETVLLHELNHVMAISFGLPELISRYVDHEDQIEVEEWLANYTGSYGIRSLSILNKLLR